LTTRVPCKNVSLELSFKEIKIVKMREDSIIKNKVQLLDLFNFVRMNLKIVLREEILIWKIIVEKIFDVRE